MVMRVCIFIYFDWYNVCNAVSGDGILSQRSIYLMTRVGNTMFGTIMISSGR